MHALRQAVLVAQIDLPPVQHRQDTAIRAQQPVFGEIQCGFAAQVATEFMRDMGDILRMHTGTAVAVAVGRHRIQPDHAEPGWRKIGSGQRQGQQAVAVRRAQRSAPGVAGRESQVEHHVAGRGKYRFPARILFGQFMFTLFEFGNVDKGHDQGN